MVGIKFLLESESPLLKIKNERKLRIIMYTVVTIHTLCISFILYYNWRYYIEQDKCIKYEGTGIIYQSVKFIVLIIDLMMVHLLSSFVIFYLSKANRLTLNEKKRIWLLIKILLLLNIVWLILRCFVRNLSSIVKPYGILLFDYLHIYRYAIQSFYDFINGFTILYGLYRVSFYAKIRRRNSSMTSGSSSSKKSKE